MFPDTFPHASAPAFVVAQLVGGRRLRADPTLSPDVTPADAANVVMAYRDVVGEAVK
jgi:hypothetical protein